MPHKVVSTTTTAASNTRGSTTHFRFLDLPLELQVNILRFIDDIETLRNCLASSQIVSAVSSQLRYVTNKQGNELTYFHGIDRWAQQAKLYSPEHFILQRNTNIGYIYIAEFRYCSHLHFYSNLRVLRNTMCFIAITDVTDHELAKRYLRLSMNGEFCAVGVFGKLKKSIT